MKIVETPTSSGLQVDFKEEKPKDVLIGKVVNLDQPAWMKAKLAAKEVKADLAEGEVKVTRRRPRKATDE